MKVLLSRQCESWSKKGRKDIFEVPKHVSVWNWRRNILVLIEFAAVTDGTPYFWCCVPYMSRACWNRAECVKHNTEHRCTWFQTMRQSPRTNNGQFCSSNLAQIFVDLCLSCQCVSHSQKIWCLPIFLLSCQPCLILPCLAPHITVLSFSLQPDNFPSQSFPDLLVSLREEDDLLFAYRRDAWYIPRPQPLCTMTNLAICLCLQKGSLGLHLLACLHTWLKLR